MGVGEKCLNFLIEQKTTFQSSGEFMPCPIWGVDAPACIVHRNFTSEPTTTEFWSPKAGGYFVVNGALARYLGSKLQSDEDKIRLSQWIAEHNILRKKAIVSNENLTEILATPALEVKEMQFRLLESYVVMSAEVSNGYYSGDDLVTTFMYRIQNDKPVKFSISKLVDSKYIASAYCGCSQNDFDWLVEAAKKYGDIEYFGGINRLTPKGLKEIQNLRKTTQSEQAFVAMWFDDAMKEVYVNAIKPATEASGYRVYRVDEDRSHSDQITNKILAEIKNSKFLIADFTHGEDGARGGVFFEAGYAMGLGIPVIWLIKKDGISEMHFDTNHYPHTFWEDDKLEELVENLKANIIAHQHIGKGPL